MCTVCCKGNNASSASANTYRNCDEYGLLVSYRRDGDTRARDELILRYLPLVYGISRRYCQRGEQLEDLVQVGSIGLIKAIDRFDLDRGVSLSTYATPNIVGEIKRYFRDKGWAVKVPRSLLELNMRLEQVSGSLASNAHRSPTVNELADAVDSTPHEVMEAMEAGRSRSSLSLDHRNGDGNDSADRSPMEAIGDDEAGFEDAERRIALEPGYVHLTPRERHILHQRFFAGLTQSRIAENIGVSQMHVSRLIRKALAKMRGEMETLNGKES